MPRRTAWVGRTSAAATNLAWGVASVALACALYQVAIIAGLLPSRYFPSIFEIGRTLIELLGTSEYWEAVGHTVRDTGLGLGLAIVVAIPLGIALGIDERVYTLTRFPVEFLRPIPAVAVIPLFVLVTGSGSETKILLAAFSTVFPILLQTIYGVRDVDPLAIQTAQAFRIGLGRRLWRIVVPSALPFIITGLRIACSIGLLVTISTEIIVGAPGIGRAISLAQGAGLEAEMYAYVVTAGLLGVVLNATLTRLEDRTAARRRAGSE
jgi:ABC-type nitrate/sulfonate/bicarbonate transport system permease component